MLSLVDALYGKVATAKPGASNWVVRDKERCAALRGGERGRGDLESHLRMPGQAAFAVLRPGQTGMVDRQQGLVTGPLTATPA